MIKGIVSPLNTLGSIVERIFSFLCALLLSQFPQYYGQYIQRLGGHLKEAELALQRYINASRSLGLSLQEYIEHHLISEERIYASSGEIITELVERYHFLEKSFTILNQANPFNRWFLFLRNVDWKIAQNTWQEFTPGVPTTPEGITYALLGLLVGWGIFHGLRGIFSRIFYRKRTSFKF